MPIRLLTIQLITKWLSNTQAAWFIGVKMQKMNVESGTKQSHIKDHADKSRVKRLQNGKQEKYEETVRKLKDKCQKVRVRPKTTGETRNEPNRNTVILRTCQKTANSAQMLSAQSKPRRKSRVEESKSRRIQETTARQRQRRQRRHGHVWEDAVCIRFQRCSEKNSLLPVIWKKNRSKETEPKRKGMGTHVKLERDLRQWKDSERKTWGTWKNM